MQYLEIGGLLTEAENSGKDINEILGESEESLSGSRQEYLNAMADSGEGIYILTIHYQDANGNTLADDYIAQYVEGEKFSIQSPEVYGYIPNYSIINSNDQSIVETMGMPSRDLEITVIYSKTTEAPEWNQNPNISIKKNIISTPKNGTRYEAGEKIKYRLTIINTGNVTIEKFRIEDTVISNSGETQYTFTKFTDPKDQTYLEAGQTGYIDYTYTVQKADLGGTIKNTAELAETVPPVPSGHKIPPVEIPTTDMKNDLEIKKEAFEGPYSTGDVISYKISITNTGNTTITDVIVTDELEGAKITTGQGYTINEQGQAEILAIAPGATVVLSANYTVQEKDLENNNKELINKAHVTGSCPDGSEIYKEDTATVSILKRYTITVRYWYAKIGGAVAGPTYIRTLFDGDPYNVASKAIAGYTVNKAEVTGTIQGEDVIFDVIYTAIPYKLTINYMYEDATVAAGQFTEILTIGDGYSVPSPTIPGYTASIPTVSGTMPGRNLTFTVIYFPNDNTDL